LHKNVAVEADVPELIDAEIRYARNGGVAIAYQVVGEGDVDLVYFVPTLLLYRNVYETETTELASHIPDARMMRVSGNDYFGTDD
jgi:hypothetical protein